jgi:hypothetical protein
MNYEVIKILASMSKHIPREQFIELVADLIDHSHKFPKTQNWVEYQQMWKDIDAFNKDFDGETI